MCCLFCSMILHGSCFFVWLEWDQLGLILCRACYSRRKIGWVRPLRAATTSATTAIHAWRSKYLPCQATSQSNQVWPVWPKPILLSSLTHHLKPITSPWVGNAAAKTTFSTPRLSSCKFHDKMVIGL